MQIYEIQPSFQFGASGSAHMQEASIVPSGVNVDQYPVLLDGLKKSYPVGRGRPPVRAVTGISAMVGQGECFGLLGVNGAGKTTVFHVLTGAAMRCARG